jgi:hypothetical protein
VSSPQPPRLPSLCPLDPAAPRARSDNLANKHLMLSSEQRAARWETGASAEVGPESSPGLLAQVLDVLLREPSDSVYRFWLGAVVESFLRGSNPADQVSNPSVKPCVSGTFRVGRELNEAQRPHLCCIRVALGTGYHRRGGIGVAKRRRELLSPTRNPYSIQPIR